jgi:hypothetical protein
VGYKTIGNPDALAASIIGQMSHKQMERRWIKGQADILAANEAGMAPELKAIFDQSQPIFGVPTI